MSDMTTQELLRAKELYLSGESLAEIGRQLGHDATTIKRNLISINVQIRTRKEQTILTNQKRRKSVNDNYFDNIGVNQAWLMGFLAADGYIGKQVNTIEISLSSKDKEILKKIKKEVEIERPIIDKTSNNGFDICKLEWTSKRHKDILATFGIVNNKTYLPLHLPSFFSDELKLAFILGFFDGDGSISKYNNYLRFRIVSHRNEILIDIATFLQNKYNCTYSLSQDNRGLWELSISTTYCVKIFKDMYNLNSLRLDRKYQKFLEYINHETTTSLITG